MFISAPPIVIPDLRHMPHSESYISDSEKIADTQGLRTVCFVLDEFNLIQIYGCKTLIP